MLQPLTLRLRRRRPAASRPSFHAVPWYSFHTNADQVRSRSDRLEPVLAGHMTAWLRQGLLDRGGTAVEADRFLPETVTMRCTATHLVMRSKHRPKHPTAVLPERWRHLDGNPHVRQERDNTWYVPLAPREHSQPRKDYTATVLASLLTPACGVCTQLGPDTTTRERREGVMEPIITTIASAIAVGAAAGFKPTVEQAIKDAYAGLKRLITDRYQDKADVVDAVEYVAKKPDAPTRREELQRALTEAGAAEDTQLLTAAKAVHTAVEQHAPDLPQGIGLDIGLLKTALLEIDRVQATAGGIGVKMGTVEADKVKIGNIGGGALPNR